MKTIQNYIILLLLLVTAIANAQNTKIEKDYLSNLATSFVSNDVIAKPTKLFWAMCLGERNELEVKELNSRINALTTNEAARIAFYKRLNYYMSSTLPYYTDLLQVRKVIPLTSEMEKDIKDNNGDYEKTTENGKVAVPAFAYEDLKAYLTHVHAFGEDTTISPNIAPVPTHSETINVISEPPLISTGPKIFTFVEQMPEYPGTEPDLLKFLQQHMMYPQMERDNDIMGKVILKFVVNAEGHVSDVKVLRGVSPNLNAEAKRVVKMLAPFKPGKQQGTAVNVYYTLPVVFKLQ